MFLNPISEFFNPTPDYSVPSLFRLEDLVVILMIGGIYIFLQFFFSWITYPFYKDMPQEIKNTWGEQFPVLINAVLLSGMAFYGILYDEKVMNGGPFAFSNLSITLMRIIAGWFICDLWMVVSNYKLTDPLTLPFYVHGVLSFFCYFFSLRPFVNEYGYRFILFEVSTFFLHIDWFLRKAYKLKRDDWKVKTNGYLLLITFFIFRILWGPYNSFHFFSECIQLIRNGAPFDVVFISITLIVSNVVLTFLNFIWFYYISNMVLLPSRKSKSSSQEKVE